jgi:hypothetical protein
MSANERAPTTEQGRDTEPADPAWNSVYKVGGKDMDVAGEGNRRRLIRYFAAFVSALTAVMYFLIGFHVVSVLDANADQTFGIFAGVAYAFGALLLLAFDRRVVWTLGAILQVFVIFTYFNLASQRTPEFEVWGILIRIAQLLILVALLYLAARPASTASAEPGVSQSL